MFAEIKVLSSILYRNKDLAVDSVDWRALSGVHGGRFCLALFVYLSSFVKEPPKMFFCGGVRLWRRAQFLMLHCRGIIARLRLRICDGRTRKM
jgi:hypothetical protein